MARRVNSTAIAAIQLHEGIRHGSDQTPSGSCAAATGAAAILPGLWLVALYNTDARGNWPRDSADLGPEYQPADLGLELDWRRHRRGPRDGGDLDVPDRPYATGRSDR